MTGTRTPDPSADGAAPVGVIGGVGPLATVYFLDKIVRLTEAERDQDHVDLVVSQHATIPDRTAFLIGTSSADPGPVMAEDARRLERYGVSFIVVPCNTAHNFTDQVVAAVGTPVVSIIDETVAAARARVPGLATVGLLATEGTASSGVYQRAFDAVGIVTVLPDDADQALVSGIIYDQVKAGLAADMDTFDAVVARLVAAGAQVIVLGCTELSVVAEDAALLADPLFVDSLDVLARATIVRSGHRVRPAAQDRA